MALIIAFGLIGIMVVGAMLLRSKVVFLQKMLVPASIIAGLLGLLAMNAGLNRLVNQDIYEPMVQFLFMISFVAIGLSKSKKDDVHNTPNIAKGALSMAFMWNLLYAGVAVIGAVAIMLIGKPFDMDPFYGMMVSYGFVQGPGQAVVYGSIFKGLGYDMASSVGLMFAVIGFLSAFLIGIPLAKYGINKGYAKHAGDLDRPSLTGLYEQEDDPVSLGRETTYSGVIDTLTMHLSIIGVTLMLGLGLSWLSGLLPGALGDAIAGMLFLHGLLAAYLVRYVLDRFNVAYILNNKLLAKVVGWSTDYLIVAAFMAVELVLVSQWLLPIMIEVVLINVVILVASLYYGRKFRGDNAFERTLGVFGAATGTVPSGIALIRIVDPSMVTTTIVELGMMNIPQMLSIVTTMIMLPMAEGRLPFGIALVLLSLQVPIYLALLVLINRGPREVLQTQE